MIQQEIYFKDEDFDSKGNLLPSVLLMKMQNAAVADAVQFGATRENLLADNIFFAVYRNILTITKQIKKGTEKAYLTTFQSNHDRMRFIRSYFIYLTKPSYDSSACDFDPYKDAVIYCNSIWILMNFKERKLVRSSDLKYPIDEVNFDFERPSKVTVDTENAPSVGVFSGKNYYIDENGHVNNTAYADIVSDFAKSDDEVKYLDITYEHEIMPDDEIDVFEEITPDGKKFCGIRKRDGNSCFYAEIRF